jgi:hypothetical protein
MGVSLQRFGSCLEEYTMSAFCSLADPFEGWFAAIRPSLLSDLIKSLWADSHSPGCAVRISLT